MTDPMPPTRSGPLGWVRRHKILTAIGVVIVLAIIGAVSGGGSGDNKPSASESLAGGPATSTATQSVPADPASDFAAAVKDALGKSNRDGVDRVKSAVYDPDTKNVIVMWAINDNLTNGLIKDGAKADIVDLLKVVQEFEKSHPVKSATFAGTFSLQDQVGNTSEDKVVQVEYPGSTVAKINFDNFLRDNVYNVAEDSFLAPAFR